MCIFVCVYICVCLNSNLLYAILLKIEQITLSKQSHLFQFFLFLFLNNLGGKSFISFRVCRINGYSKQKRNLNSHEESCIDVYFYILEMWLFEVCVHLCIVCNMYILQVYKLQKSRFISILGTFRESRSTPFVRLLFHSIRLDLSIHPSSVQTITLQKQHLSLCREIWISSFSIPPSSKQTFTYVEHKYFISSIIPFQQQSFLLLSSNRTFSFPLLSSTSTVVEWIEKNFLPDFQPEIHSVPPLLCPRGNFNLRIS